MRSCQSVRVACFLLAYFGTRLIPPVRHHPLCAAFRSRTVRRCDWHIVSSTVRRLHVVHTLLTFHSVQRVGKGFQGGMKRHGFRGLRASHGVSISHRSLGSTGQHQVRQTHFFWFIFPRNFIGPRPSIPGEENARSYGCGPRHDTKSPCRTC